MQTVKLGDWARSLDEFTRRNAGRTTRLEEDGPEIGAQVEETSWPLRGVAFDPHDGSVEVMVGDLATVDGHLTRIVRGVESIELLSGPTGQDAALRLAHGGGQTLLRLI